MDFNKNPIYKRNGENYLAQTTIGFKSEISYGKFTLAPKKFDVGIQIKKVWK